MFLALPILAYGLLYQLVRRRFAEVRAALLAAAVIWSSCLLAITEALSLFNLITRAAVALAWCLTCVLAALVTRKLDSAPAATEPPQPFPPLPAFTKFLLAIVAFICVIVLLLAFVAPPGTWDAMEYHLPRTILWMSDHNV